MILVLEGTSAAIATRAAEIIAARLGISSHTAKYHVASILAKLGAGSRTEAVTIGMRRGLVTI
jgi:DNA-binding CsgD family transcriptional regulator